MPASSPFHAFLLLVLLFISVNALAHQPRCADNADPANVRIESGPGFSRVHVRFEISHDAWFSHPRQRASVGLHWGFEYHDPDGRVHRWHGTGLDYFANRRGSIRTLSTMSHAYHAPIAEILDLWVASTNCHVTG